MRARRPPGRSPGRSAVFSFCSRYFSLHRSHAAIVVARAQERARLKGRSPCDKVFGRSGEAGRPAGAIGFVKRRARKSAVCRTPAELDPLDRRQAKRDRARCNRRDAVAKSLADRAVTTAMRMAGRLRPALPGSGRLQTNADGGVPALPRGGKAARQWRKDLDGQRQSEKHLCQPHTRHEESLSFNFAK